MGAEGSYPSWRKALRSHGTKRRAASSLALSATHSESLRLSGGEDPFDMFDIGMRDSWEERPVGGKARGKDSRGWAPTEEALNGSSQQRLSTEALSGGGL